MKAQAKLADTEVKITRHIDAKFANRVVNDPSVYDWVRGPLQGEIDVSPLVEDIGNILLAGEHGCVILIRQHIGTYDIHTQILPSGRGKWCVDFMHQVLRWMFTQTSAVELTSRVPKGNLGALALVRSFKLRPEFTLERGWVIRDKPVPATVYSIQLQDWIRNFGPVSTGKWFAKRLAEEYAKHGVKTEVMAGLSDPHFAQVGAAIEMIFGGQREKGVIFYNRWASMVGITPIQIVTLNPLVVECQGALIRFRPNDFWIVSCP